MSAHPMIQPTDWLKEPDSLIGGISEDRRLLYQMVWDKAIACTLRSPLLVHNRHLFQCDQHVIAVATVTASATRVGYWKFRQDFPKFPFPHQSVLIKPTGLTLVKVEPKLQNRTTIGDLIFEMKKNRVGTSAGVAELLEKQFVGYGKNGFVSYSRTQKNGSIQIQVTTLGRAAVSKWSNNNLIGNAAKVTDIVSSVRDGHIGYRQALDEITNDAALSLSAAEYIEIQCEKCELAPVERTS